jgi:hypothetical protein
VGGRGRRAHSQREGVSQRGPAGEARGRRCAGREPGGDTGRRSAHPAHACRRAAGPGRRGRALGAALRRAAAARPGEPAAQARGPPHRDPGWTAAPAAVRRAARRLRALPDRALRHPLRARGRHVHLDRPLPP